MIIRTELIKETCAKILTAVDDSAIGVVTEMLELNIENDTLHLYVTNKEYFAEVKLPLGETVAPLNATVNAKLFLKLIAQMTSDTIEFRVDENVLTVKGNGTYKLPLIFENDNMLHLPRISIDNVTSEMTIDGELLMSILTYNSKEIQKNSVVKPVQKLYYVDESGCITFTSGACVNSFTLSKPIKVLFNNKLVKLFKLFKGKTVNFYLGYDAISDEIVQTKVKFDCEDISITSILSCDDTLLNSVPVEAIRRRANTLHPYSVTLHKDAVTETINRLLLFANEGGKDATKFYSTFEFEGDFVTVFDSGKKNSEILYYNNENSNVTEKYSAILDLTDLKNIIDTCSEQYVTINFGDNQAIVIPRGNVRNVVPEIHINAN
jgi:DNA polymerase III sliding clamp (beta) subunit (PCNA family)